MCLLSSKDCIQTQPWQMNCDVFVPQVIGANIVYDCMYAHMSGEQSFPKSKEYFMGWIKSAVSATHIRHSDAISSKRNKQRKSSVCSCNCACVHLQSHVLSLLLRLFLATSYVPTALKVTSSQTCFKSRKHYFIQTMRKLKLPEDIKLERDRFI